MSDDAEKFADVPCPMPGCEQPLYLIWDLSRGLYAGDLEDAAGIPPEDAHVSTWRIECGDGHVVLLPGSPWCDCDDPQGDGCGHGPDEFDWTEEHRQFRPRDMARLRELLAKLGGAA